MELTHQLHAKRQYIHASPLQPAATAAIVRVRDGKPFVTDGPFIETREQLAGYFLIDAKDPTSRSPSLVGYLGRASALSRSGRCERLWACPVISVISQKFILEIPNDGSS